jgi:hypothetical protein
MTAMFTSHANVLPLPFGARGEGTWMCPALRSEERAGVRGWAGLILHFNKKPFYPAAGKSAALSHTSPSPQPSPRRGEGVASLL